jgi:hypothetical protein
MSELYTFLLLQITVGVIEIVIFLLGAVVLGFFIHFFLSSRSSIIPPPSMEPSVLAENINLPSWDETIRITAPAWHTKSVYSVVRGIL